MTHKKRISWNRCCLLILLLSLACSAPKTQTSPSRTVPDSPSSESVESMILKFEESVSQEDEMDEDGEPKASGIKKIPIKTQPHREIPFQFNQRVADWIRYFSQTDRERFQRFLDRGEPYREVVEEILEENGVPKDIYYLGLIESGFHIGAKSHAQAVGVWQFMRATGKEYGLGVDAYRDERRDPIAATEAAARYLRSLKKDLGSWYLALAAYNAGPGRVRGAIRRGGGSREFWDLVQKRVLPKETMDYVPKFLAARYIGENPDQFGFVIDESKRYPDVDLVKVPSPVKFFDIEKFAGIPEGTLSFVNPHYLKGHTHPKVTVDEIWVPEKFSTKVEALFSTLKNNRIVVASHAPKKPTTPYRATASKQITIKIKRGESLKTIAKKYGLSVAYLKKVNGLRSTKLAIGQTLKLKATQFRKQKSYPRKRARR